MPSVSYAMPNYRYTAVDASGKTVEGTILAGSLREVSQGLRQRGLKVSQITEAGPATAAAAPTPPPALSPQPVSQPAPVAVAPEIVAGGARGLCMQTAAVAPRIGGERSPRRGCHHHVQTR